MAAEASEQALVQRLIEHPRDPAALGAVYQATFANPRRYAELLSAAAAETADELAGSHWLAEAASVRLEALSESLAAIALLEEALDRDPLNDRAARLLESVLRRGGDIHRVARFLTTYVQRLEAQLGVDPTTAEVASDSYERLGLLLADVIGDREGAIFALKRALELKRFAHGPATEPPTKADTTPPESAWYWRSNDDAVLEMEAILEDASMEGAADIEEEDDEESRDTLVSPVPISVRSERPTVPRTEPSPAPNADEPLEEPAAPDEEDAEDRLMGLFESLHAIRSCETVVEASALVLQIARDAIRSEGGMIHLYDAARGDFVVVAATGSHHESILRGRTPPTDPLLRAAVDAPDPLLVDSASPRLVGGRFQVIRPRRAVACVALRQDGPCLGAIEMVDPVGRQAFTDPDRHALTYVGERFADFLAERKPVLD